MKMKFKEFYTERFKYDFKKGDSLTVTSSDIADVWDTAIDSCIEELQKVKDKQHWNTELVPYIINRITQVKYEKQPQNRNREE